MGMTAIRRVCQRMLLGVVVVLIVAMGLGVFFVGLPKASNAGPDYLYHGPAVRVNGITLKDAEFQKHYANVARQAAQYAMYGESPTVEQMREDALQNAIRELVIRAEIKKNKISVPNADVNRYFNRLAKQYFPTKEERQQFYERNEYRGDRDFKTAIKEYLEQIYLYRELAKNKKIDITVTQAEIRDAYATRTLSHILLGTQAEAGGMTDAEAKKKADEVYAKIKAGGDWDKLAKEYSTDTSNKDKGGSLGEIKVNDLKTSYDKAFTEAALKLKKGEYSEPVKSQFGYHLIKLVDSRDASGPEFKNESRATEAELVAQKFFADENKYKDWVQARTADAEVIILDPALRAYQLKIKGEWAEAAKFYEKAVKMRQHRWDRDVFLSALEVFEHEKQLDKAITYGRRALGRLSEDMDLNAAVGKALYTRNKDKDRKDGLALLAKAKSLAGDDMQALGKIARVYQDLKLTKESQAIEKKIQDLLKAQAEEEARQQKEYEEELAKQQKEAATAEAAEKK